MSSETLNCYITPIRLECRSNKRTFSYPKYNPRDNGSAPASRKQSAASTTSTRSATRMKTHYSVTVFGFFVKRLSNWIYIYCYTTESGGHLNSMMTLKLLLFVTGVFVVNIALNVDRAEAYQDRKWNANEQFVSGVLLCFVKADMQSVWQFDDFDWAC